MEEELSEKKRKRYKVIRIILQLLLLLAFLAFCIYSTIRLYPIISRIQSDEIYRDEIVQKIRSYGGWVWIIILLAQALQCILAVIPSGPIVMLSGILFNPPIAIILCIIGQTIGAICVYYLVKFLGYRFFALFMNPDKIKESRFLKNPLRCEVLMFGYLLIPALPKDIVAFVAPFTKVRMKNFILINFIARIPMTIVTVFMGNSLISGSYIVAIVLACFSLLMAIFCIVFNGKIVLFLEKKNNEQKTE